MRLWLALLLSQWNGLETGRYSLCPAALLPVLKPLSQLPAETNTHPNTAK